MFVRHCLGIDETMRAINAVLEEARREPERPVAVAVVDDRGDLIAFARMDNVGPRPVTMAQNKAHTAALVRTDTVKYEELLRQRGTSTADAGDPRLTSTQGGLVIRFGGAVIGGIGVGGHEAQRDEELARVGLKALGLL